MTIEQLKEKQEKITNAIYQGQMRSYTNQHLTNLSIEYAISVLADIKDDFPELEDRLNIEKRIHLLKSYCKI